MATVSLENWFKRPHKCSKKCPIYPCPFQPLAQSEKNEDGICILYKLNERDRKRIIKIKSLKEEEFNELIVDYLAELFYKAKAQDWQAQRRLLLDLLKIKNAIFGKKHRIEGNMKSAISIEDLRKLLEEEEE